MTGGGRDNAQQPPINGYYAMSRNPLHSQTQPPVTTVANTPNSQPQQQWQQQRRDTHHVLHPVAGQAVTAFQAPWSSNSRDYVPTLPPTHALSLPPQRPSDYQRYHSAHSSPYQIQGNRGLIRDEVQRSVFIGDSSHSRSQVVKKQEQQSTTSSSNGSTTMNGKIISPKQEGNGKNHSLGYKSGSLYDEEARFKRLSIRDSYEAGVCEQLDQPMRSSGSGPHALSTVDVADFNADQNYFRKELTTGTQEKFLSSGIRNLCRRDIDKLRVPFLAIFDTLIPTEEEKAKQKQLLALLQRLVSQKWPKAQLYLFGSCANSFGITNSDIDVCIALENAPVRKRDIFYKLASTFRSNGLQNVEAVIRTRVPIVKFMDPATGISCDICLNNVMGIINSKLLSDYAKIDVRLRQLALIVKYWAKSRGVNKTYQGTLSSYAYVIMCIHFLQQCNPPILPCLQGMEPTYSVPIDDITCAYFDEVEKLDNFGSYNKETIAQLVWGFFNYWAYVHNYTNDVISIRVGNVISKVSKNWNNGTSTDRHLMSIEDPFLLSRDLGRVVDQYTLGIMKEEFKRAANILQNDPDPCTKLFEPKFSSR